VGKSIQWYVVELERLLKGSVPPIRLSETLCEIEEHLKDDSAALGATCRHGEDTEMLAINRLGSPLKVAYQEINQRGRKRYWNAALWPMGFAVAIAVSFLLSAGGSILAMIGWKIATCGFVVSSIIGRKRTPAALTYVAIGITVGCLLVYSVLFAARFPETRMILRSEIASARSASVSKINYLQRNKDWFVQGKLLFSQPTPTNNPSYFQEGRYLVPPSMEVDSVMKVFDPALSKFLTSIPDGIPASMWSYTERSWRQAKRRWSEFRYLGDQQLAENNATIKWLDQMQTATYRDTFQALLPQLLPVSLGFWIGLVLLNALCAELYSFWHYMVLLSRRPKALA
jgi:hypothetical protein